MNILIIGSGGREHSISRTIAAKSTYNKLYCAPGNPGTAAYCENVAISDADIYGLLSFAKENAIDLTIVGPEAPLALGIVDQFENEGLAIVGPCQAAAQMESSKAWAKAFMKEFNIPTASYEVFETYETALDYVSNHTSFPTVIKADGLAAGKGVTVCFTLEEAVQTLKNMMQDKLFADAGSRVVIESFLKGEEASILAFTDGETIIPLESAQDHKPVFDGDKGPNTGGMGAYSPAPVVTPEVSKKVLNDILMPLLNGMKSRGIKLKGIVYAGLMIDNGKPSVVEFNMRFGDPETQVVLPRLKTDLLEVFQAIVDNRLDQIKLEWHDFSAVCVVLASKGYPASSSKGDVITGLGSISSSDTQFVIQAGTKQESDQLLTNGGRVLGVVGTGSSIEAAIQSSYQAVDTIQFDGAHYRKDIGAKAVNVQ